MSIQTKRGQSVRLTELDAFQVFAKFPTFPNRHGLLCRVLRKIELDVNSKIILVRAGLPGAFSALLRELKHGSKVGASDERSHVR